MMVPPRQPHLPASPPLRLYRCRASAFSLVELLIVIVIIGILAAIIIPLTGRAIDSARQIKCAANMRLYLQAVPLYVADNRGLLPECRHTTSNGTAEVRIQLAPYLQAPPALTGNALYHWAGENANCASSTKATVDGTERSWIFGFNAYLNQKANLGPPLPYYSLGELSRLIYVVDTTGSRAIRPETFSILTKDFGRAAPRPHRGKINVGYLDGHVELRLASSLLLADFTRSTPSFRDSHTTTHVTTPEFDR